MCSDGHRTRVVGPLQVSIYTLSRLEVIQDTGNGFYMQFKCPGWMFSFQLLSLWCLVNGRRMCLTTMTTRRDKEVGMGENNKSHPRGKPISFYQVRFSLSMYISISVWSINQASNWNNILGTWSFQCQASNLNNIQPVSMESTRSDMQISQNLQFYYHTTSINK